MHAVLVDVRAGHSRSRAPPGPATSSASSGFIAPRRCSCKRADLVADGCRASAAKSRVLPALAPSPGRPGLVFSISLQLRWSHSARQLARVCLPLIAQGHQIVVGSWSPRYNSRTPGYSWIRRFLMPVSSRSPGFQLQKAIACRSGRRARQLVQLGAVARANHAALADAAWARRASMARSSRSRQFVQGVEHVAQRLDSASPEMPAKQRARPGGTAFRERSSARQSRALRLIDSDTCASSRSIS